MEALLEYGILAVFIALMLAPLGLPIPEEISLLAAGVLVKSGYTNAIVGLVVGYLGVVGGDCIAWGMGRRVGLNPTGFISRLVGPKQIKRISGFYNRHGHFAIVIARMIPGMRFPTFFFAGASRVSLGRFLFIDGTTAIVMVNLYFWMGHYFANDIDSVLVWIKRLQVGGSSLVFLGILAGILWILRRRIRQRQWNTLL